MREVPLNTSRRALVTERLLRRPRNRKCRLVRDSILCCYGLGRAFLRTLDRMAKRPGLVRRQKARALAARQQDYAIGAGTKSRSATRQAGPLSPYACGSPGRQSV